jgi:large subunit ribosomal protein L25
MHENAPVLTAKKRERLGSRYAARVREQGGLPAIVYGHGEEPLPVSVDAHIALGLITKGEKVFQLQMDGNGAAETVLLKDVQFDYLGSRIVHCDFARVSLTERVTVSVPVRLIGEAKGLKTVGAVLMHPTGDLDIECIVTDIPDFIEVDITDLDVNHTITAADIKLPRESMTVATDPHAILAHVVVQAAGPATAEGAVVEGGAATPEVLREKKDAAGAKGGAAGAKAPAAGAKPAGGDKKK